MTIEESAKKANTKALEENRVPSSPTASSSSSLTPSSPLTEYDSDYFKESDGLYGAIPQDLLNLKNIYYVFYFMIY